MATRTQRKSSNGNTSLAAAMAMLLQNQAKFVSHLDEDRRRFARIEREMAEIKALLLKHDQILKHHDQALSRLEAMLKDLPEAIQNLPEAIQKKIVFRKN
jgi:hypothetical protein